MATSAAAVIHEMARRLTRGEFDTLHELFTFPYPIFFHDSMLVVRNAEQAKLASMQYYLEIRSRGVATVSAECNEIPLTQENVHRLRVHSKYADAAGNLLATSDNEVYLRRSDDGAFRIEQINILDCDNEALKGRFRRRIDMVH